MFDQHRLSVLTDRYAGVIGHRPTACVVTFGCQMNAHDSEKIKGVLAEAGFRLSDQEESDFVIYNTCTVRENANTRVYGRLGQLKNYKKDHPHMIIAVCGCMMQEQRAAAELKNRLPFVDLVFGTFNLDRFPVLLEQTLINRLGNIHETLVEIYEKEYAGEADRLPSKRSFTFKAGVNIMYGCNNFCSYCIVPYVRGRERSRTKEEIMQEIKMLHQDGVKEIMLLGQNVNSYGKTLENPVSFAQLLECVAAESGMERIRFMTSHPKDLSDDLIRVMAENQTVCKHLHLPVQSGSNRILKAMNRRYTRENYLALVDKLRKAIPDLSLTTDIMIGFPGEEERDVADTIDLVKQAGFDNAFTFIYSKRQGTPAATMPGQIDGETAAARFNQLLEAVHETAYKRCERFVGMTLPVMIEDQNRHQEGWMTGRTEHNLLVHFPTDSCRIGSTVPVKIVESKGFYLIGRRV